MGESGSGEGAGLWPGRRVREELCNVVCSVVREMLAVRGDCSVF